MTRSVDFAVGRVKMSSSQSIRPTKAQRWEQYLDIDDSPETLGVFRSSEASGSTQAFSRVSSRISRDFQGFLRCRVSDIINSVANNLQPTALSFENLLIRVTAMRVMFQSQVRRYHGWIG